jgi:hypothetical protein
MAYLRERCHGVGHYDHQVWELAAAPELNNLVLTPVVNCQGVLHGPTIGRLVAVQLSLLSAGHWAGERQSVFYHPKAGRLPRCRQQRGGKKSVNKFK